MTRILTDNEFVVSFQERAGLVADGVAGPDTLAVLDRVLPLIKVSRKLAVPARFYDHVRRKFGPLSQSQVNGFNTLLGAMSAWPVSWVAYGLATAWHETAATMQPIAEFGKGRGKRYGVPGRNGGQVAYGRGYVQLTWDENYERADRELGLNGALVADYDKAMDPDIAAAIMVRGMAEGWFTGKANRDYLPGDYVGARRIINGTDKAAMIAGYAVNFADALVAGDWE